MNRAALAAIVCLCACWTAARAQPNFDDVQIKTTHVAGNIYMLEGQGGNIGVSVGSDGLLMVDDQFAPLAPKIRAALQELAKKHEIENDLVYILNTHWHFDHTGGNADFGKEGTIIAHENVRRRLATRQSLFGRDIEPAPAEALPVITFNDSLSIHFNGDEIRATHLPHGHTDGDIVIHFTEANVLHLGDLMFNGTFPFIDLDHGGDVVGYADNVERILGQLPAGAKIIPGHGPLAGAEDLKTFHGMLSETITIVRSRLEAGKKPEAIVAEGLPDKWASWGNGFIKTDQWLGTITKSLTRKGNSRSE